MINRTRDEQIEKLIEIGLSGKFELLESLFPKMGMGESCYLLNLNWYIKSYFKVLAETEIAVLIKVLIEAENRGLYDSGSTSQIYHMFRELRQRGYEETDSLEEWAFQNAKNCYVPFGSCGKFRDCAKSVEDYHRLASDWNDKIFQQKFAKQGKEEATRKTKAEQYDKQHKRQLEISKKRREIIETLVDLEPIQRMTVIASDSEHPPYFYPAEFACLSEDQVREIPYNIKKLLLKKLKTPPGGNWKKLMKMLIYLENLQPPNLHDSENESCISFINSQEKI